MHRLVRRPRARTRRRLRDERPPRPARRAGAHAAARRRSPARLCACGWGCAVTAPAVPRALTEPGRAAIEALFREHLARGWHPGAQLAVYRDGILVLDLAGGEADRIRRLDSGSRMLYFS